MVGLELEVMAKKMDRFGWERDRGTAAHDRVVADWMNALSDYPLDEVKEACRRHVQDRPNTMPHEGHILYQLGKIRRRKADAFKAENPPRPKPAEPRVTSEQTAKILEEVSLNIKTFGGRDDHFR